MKKVYIGLDIHKESVSIALALAGTDEPESCGKAPEDLESFLRVLRRILKKHQWSKEDVALCYEAGPTGFVLARRMLHLKFDIIVVASSKTPKCSGKRVRTDRRDGRKLARHPRAGELVAVHIPDVADEVICDVCRARTDAVDDQSRSCFRSGSFLLCTWDRRPFVEALCRAFAVSS